MIDAATIETIIVRVVHCIDRKRWTDLHSLFAESIDIDYCSLFGGNPETLSSDKLIEGWRTNLGSVVTQHLLGPIEVDVAAGEARCHVRALHYSAAASHGDSWEVLGHYEFSLSPSGQITRMKLDTFHQIGNRQLLSEVRAHEGS